VARALLPAKSIQKNSSISSSALATIKGSQCLISRGIMTFGARTPHGTFNPQPTIVFWSFRQPPPYRVLPDVFNRFPKAFVSPQDMIERLVLPNRSGPSAEFIDTAGRSSLDGSQDFRKCEGPAIDIPHGREQQVCVIGHDYDGMNLDCLAIVMEAVLKA
jgi:hypothetical protein